MSNLDGRQRRVLMIAMTLALLLLTGAAAFAQQPTLQDPLLDKMLGNWVLTGTITGKPVTHDVAIRWVLNHQFVEIHEVSQEKTSNGSPQYEAWVFLGWDSPKNRYVVHWIDVFGGGFSSRGYAPKEESSIPIVFESDDGKFHTTFSLNRNTNIWFWAMDNEQNGKLREFARLKMVRKK
jgi:hypothetical protein